MRLREDGSPIFLGIKPTGFDVELAGTRALHYDLEGRLLKSATANLHWRRGLSHRCVELRKRPGDEGGGLQARLLEVAETDRLVDQACGQLRQLRDALRARTFTLDFARPTPERALAEIQRRAEQAAAFDAAASHRDAARFKSLYTDIPILPPDQYGALVLLATEGCSYNRCTFCGFYRSMRFAVKDPDEFRRHVQQAIHYHGEGLAMRRGIFLGQANALAAPAQWRREILQTINDVFQFPAETSGRVPPHWWQGAPRRFDGIASFIDAFSGVRISAEQFEQLRRLNLRRIYLGVETGDPQLLDWLAKPATPQEMLAVVRAAKAARLHVGVVILLGAGGERFFASHVEQTSGLLNAMRLERGDYVYLSPLAEVPAAEYRQRAAAEGIEPLSPARMIEQAKEIRARLQPASPKAGPYVARYDFSHFVY